MSCTKLVRIWIVLRVNILREMARICGVLDLMVPAGLDGLVSYLSTGLDVRLGQNVSIG